MKRYLFLILLCGLGFMLTAGCGSEEREKASAPEKEAASQPTFLAIGTGSDSGNYYRTGQALAELVNRKIDQYNLRLSVEATGGSIFNIKAIMAGDLQFGIVQSDSQWDAVRGKKEWKQAGPQTDLRAVCSFYPESVTLVAAVDSGIKNIMDLKGKRVNIGNPGSGQRQNAIDALTAVNIDYKIDLNAEGIKATESDGLLQDGRIDAFFYTISHPNGPIRAATNGRRKVRFASITGIDNMIKRYPYYAKSAIPTDLYPGALNENKVDTFGVKATLVTSSLVSGSVVYALTKETFENFNEFKGMNPANAHLTIPGMLKALSAPLHPGALRYYKEAGLM